MSSFERKAILKLLKKSDNIKKHSNFRHWEDWEIKIISDESKSIKQLEKLLPHRSAWAIRYRYLKIGFYRINFQKQKKWTKEEIISQLKERDRKRLLLNNTAVRKNDSCLYASAYKRFGSWDNALRIAGINPEKHRLHKKWTKEKANEYIKRFEGELIDDEFKGYSKYHWWKCLICGSIFRRTLADIIRCANFCLRCVSLYSKKEEMCRAIFEKALGKNFPKVRNILTNRQELDGYCEELNLAFEYNGRQHYEFVKYIHKTKKMLLKQKKKDIQKRQICQEMGIKLVEIPCYKANITENLVSFIYSQIEKLGFKIICRKLPDFKNIYKSKFKRFQSLISENNGGKLLDIDWNRNIVIIKCSCGREYRRNEGNLIRSIKNNNLLGCMKCVIRNRSKKRRKYNYNKIVKYIKVGVQNNESLPIIAKRRKISSTIIYRVYIACKDQFTEKEKEEVRKVGQNAYQRSRGKNRKYDYEKIVTLIKGRKSRQQIIKELKCSESVIYKIAQKYHLSTSKR